MFSARTKPKIRHERRHHDNACPSKRGTMSAVAIRPTKCTHEESCSFLANSSMAILLAIADHQEFECSIL